MTSREYLNQHHIQWTQARLQVVDYMMTHHTHPTADEVYQGMIEGGADISRATVFNTLNILTEKDALRALQIEDGVTRYDILISPHAHFRCVQCGAIYDVELTRNASFRLPEDFHPCHTDYYIVGCCPACYAKQVHSPEADK